MELVSNRKYIVYIVADTNDGDYVTEETELTGDEIERFIMPVAAKIKAWNEANPRTNDHNWASLGYACTHPSELYELDDETSEYWSEITPYGEHGIHTIETVEIRPLIIDKIVLL